MKILSIVLILLCATPVFAQITPEELRAIIREEVRSIVQEEVRSIVQEEMDELEKDMREYVKLNVEKLEAQMKGSVEKLEAQMEGFDKRLGVFDKRLDDLGKSVSFISVIVQILFAFVALAVGLPQIVNTFRNQNYRRTQQDSSPQEPAPNSPKTEETLET